MAESQPESDAPYLAALERIAAGDSTRAACLAAGVKASALVMRVVRGSDPAFSEQYARAREGQAICDAEKVDASATELLELARSGEPVDNGRVNSYRAAIDALKWAAARKHPKVYGDRTELSVTGAIATLVRLDVDPALAEGLRLLGERYSRGTLTALPEAAPALPTVAGATDADPPAGG